jgi:hypothetical protein
VAKNVIPKEPNQISPGNVAPSEQLAGVIVKGLDLIRKPYGIKSLIVTITLAGFYAIAAAHSEFAAAITAVFGSVALFIALIATLKKAS